MPYIRSFTLSGHAEHYEQLIERIVEWTTNKEIHGEDAWELMRSEPWPRGTILKAKGLQNQDNIYIGLMALRIGSKSYENWYFTAENIGKYFVWSPMGINQPGLYFRYSGRTVLTNPAPENPDSKYTYHSIYDANIFAAEFVALVFGVFKQYVPELNWDEQPGGLNIDVAATGLKQGARITSPPTGDSVKAKFTLPLYPGAGYPGLGMNSDEPFDFWLKKDKSNLVVITRNNTGETEYWDAAQAGLLVPHHAKMQYPFPAFVAGSSSGARSVGRMDYTINPNGAPLIDVQIDYGRNHWMLTRGVPTFPAMAINAKNSFSQIVLCMPDGAWQYFANQYQTMARYYFPNNSTPIFIEARPVQLKPVHYVLPTYNDLRGTTHIFRQNNETTADTKTNQVVYKLEVLNLVQDDGAKKNMLGYIPHMFWNSIPSLFYDEITINGKKCFALPNGWEGRRWYYRILDGEYRSEVIQRLEDEITAKTKQMNCLIRLED